VALGRAGVPQQEEGVSVNTTELRGAVVAALEQHLQDAAAIAHPDVPAHHAVAKMLTGKAADAERLYQQIEIAKSAGRGQLDRLAVILKIRALADVAHAPNRDDLRHPPGYRPQRRETRQVALRREFRRRVSEAMTADPKCSVERATRMALAAPYEGVGSLADAFDRLAEMED
jgi:hypothetical protein